MNGMMLLLRMMKRSGKRRVMRGKERAEGSGADVRGELLLRRVKIVLDLTEFMLEKGDVADATIDRISEPGLSLVGEGVDGVFALRRAELVEELGDVARAEHPVHVSELLGLIRREVGGEDAALSALAAQELAGGAGGVGRGHSALIDQNLFT